MTKKTVEPKSLKINNCACMEALLDSYFSETFTIIYENISRQA